jgi:carbon monoxide dehydrogenase subunit G
VPKLEKSIHVNASPEQVWAVASDYDQWHTWFVGLSAPKSVKGDGGQGTVIEHTVTVHNIPMPLKTTVTTCDSDACWRGEYTGPMTKGSQQWTYVPVEGGTEVTLVMETELMGPAKLAEKMVINAFDSMTDQALVNLKARVEGA